MVNASGIRAIECLQILLLCVEIPFSEEQFQIKTLFIVKVLWGKKKKIKENKNNLQLLELSSGVFTPWAWFPLGRFGVL